MIVIIDNFDSFTYNLYQFVGEINPDVRVFRNNSTNVKDLEAQKPDHIIISPGPGYPNSAGISKEVIATLGEKIPILGVCLGHQAIGEVFGSNIVLSPKMYHGKTSIVKHSGRDIYKDIENPMPVMRYHSLTIDKNTISNEIEINASTDDGEIMGIKHKTYPIYGVQFHPESIMTPRGKDIIRNFLNIKRGERDV